MDKFSTPDPRMWWRNSYQRLKEVECPNSLPQVLKAVGLAESTTQAATLLKANAVEFRPWDLSRWWAKADLKMKLPEGAPLLLRTGKRQWGLQTVMFPVEDQTIRFWEFFIEDGQEPYFHWRGVDYHGVPSVGFTRSHSIGVKVHEKPNPGERKQREMYNVMLHAAMSNQKLYGLIDVRMQ